jgi:hypothetical protein
MDFKEKCNKVFKKIWALQKSNKNLILKYSNFMKMHPMGAELFYVDRWTDIITLTVAFYNFVNMPTKESVSWNHVSHRPKATYLSDLKKKSKCIKFASPALQRSEFLLSN